MLDIRPVDVAAGEFEIGLNGLASVLGVADDQPAYHQHPVAVQVLDCLKVALPALRPSSRAVFLAEARKKFEIAFENVFDPEKDIAKSGALHQRRQCLAMVGDR